MAMKRAGNGDIFSKLKRSEVMSKIRSKNTKIELLVFRALRKQGIYFQKHYTGALGKPDIALPRKRKAVFIDSGFWHGYRYQALKPKLTKKFWRDKIEYNMRRDKRTNLMLKKDGWQVLRVWEHKIRKNSEKTIAKIIQFLK